MSRLVRLLHLKIKRLLVCSIIASRQSSVSAFAACTSATPLLALITDQSIMASLNLHLLLPQACFILSLVSISLSSMRLGQYQYCSSMDNLPSCRSPETWLITASLQFKDGQLQIATLLSALLSIFDPATVVILVDFPTTR